MYVDDNQFRLCGARVLVQRSCRGAIRQPGLKTAAFVAVSVSYDQLLSFRATRVVADETEGDRQQPFCLRNSKRW